MITPTPEEIENAFVPDLRRPMDPLPDDATMKDLIDRVNLLSALADQSIVELIGTDGEQIIER